MFDDNILAVFAVFCLQLALVGVGDPITAAHLQHMKAWGKTLPKSWGKYSFPKSTGDKLSLGILTGVHTFPPLWCSDQIFIIPFPVQPLMLPVHMALSLHLPLLSSTIPSKISRCILSCFMMCPLYFCILSCFFYSSPI